MLSIIENMVVSLAIEQNLTKKLSITAEAARSAYTKDSRSDRVTKNTDNPIDGIIPLTNKASTQYYGAFKGSINYAMSWATIGLGYERVGPDYKTLGAYYFNNDFQNTTINLSTSLFKKRVSIASNLGLQRNNLDDQKQSQTKRVVGAINIGANVSDKVTLSGSYSNFQTFTTILPVEQQVQQLTPFVNYDSLNFVQLAQNTTLGGTYRISANKKRVNTLTGSASQQKVSSKQGTEGVFVDGSVVYNGTLGYTFTYIPASFSLNTGFNTTHSKTPAGNNKLYGVSIGASMPFFKKKITSNLNVNMNQSYLNNEQSGLILVVGAGLRATLKEAHSLGLSANYLNNSTNDLQSITLNFNYSYSFGLLNGKKKESKKDNTAT